MPRLGDDSRWSLLTVAAGWLAACGSALPAAEVESKKLPPAATERVDFKRDVYPILVENCFDCHKGKKAKSGHRLDLRDELLGLTNGKQVVEPGHSERSRLIHMVAGAIDKKQMPPEDEGEPLAAKQIGILRAWIDQGLKWDDALLPPLSAEVNHWAFKPVTEPPVPTVKNAAWVRNPIDAFIAARHDEKSLTPSPEASRRTLIRRLSFHLLGLPPLSDEVESFVSDSAPDAYEKLVERMLQSSEYGERWGRHWLDLARWSESEGYENDHPRPYSWRYRDYVVASFNADKPFDRFVLEQLAGDELSPFTDENLVATGFLASARLSSNEEDKWRQRNDVLVDIVNATASVFLGLTMNCAQCHNHKFDPISQRDYYRLEGFFVKGAPNNVTLRDPALWEVREKAKPQEYDALKKVKDLLYERGRTETFVKVRARIAPELLAALDVPSDKRTDEQEKLARQASLQLQFTPDRFAGGIPDEDRKLYDEVRKKLDALDKKVPDVPQTFGFYSPATSPHKVDVLPMKGFYPPPYEPEELTRTKPYLLVAGEVNNRGPEVDIGWPAVFGPVPEGAIGERPRTALARWLIDPRNPLTRRVWVNRIWQYHFGRGLVATSSDFGTRGAPPTHSELLDWLAGELVRGGWSTKHLHRLIVLSSTYRQSSAWNLENAKRDPDNSAWWRWMPHRLESEAIRDAMLVVSGELDHHMGGPGIKEEEDTKRRSLYLFQKRHGRPSFQALFDGPLAMESCPRRHISTVSLQPLFLLNHPFVLARAQSLAKRVEREAASDENQQIQTAFRLVLGRLPDESEMEFTRGFFHGQPPAKSSGQPVPLPPLVQFCHALLNLNEFLYVE